MEFRGSLQSIPLGRNWVYEIEQALKNSKIVFVLLSPNSIRSNWTYFEAGYAYSKDIKVVPIGVSGIDLSQIQPPMSLLQGFNINSVESLNNIISILNREFDYSLEASFNYEEYAEIFGIQTAKTSDILKEYISLINDISAEVASDIDKPIEAIADYFKSHKIEYQSEETMINTYGMSIYKNKNLLSFRIDPNLLDLTIPLMGDIIKLVRGGSFEFYPLTIDFMPSVNCILEPHKISSRIYKTEIKILDNYEFGYSNIVFDVARRYFPKGLPYPVTTYQRGGPEVGSACMEIKYYGKNLAEIPIYNLLNRLFEFEILY